jgi:hypothetical protein
MRSSPDLGKTFGPLVALVNHGNASFMNPNAIWDDHTQAVILQFTYIQCNLDCKGGGDCCDDKFLGHEAPSLFQVPAPVNRLARTHARTHARVSVRARVCVCGI